MKMFFSRLRMHVTTRRVYGCLSSFFLLKRSVGSRQKTFWYCANSNLQNNVEFIHITNFVKVGEHFLNA